MRLGGYIAAGWGRLLWEVHAMLNQRKASAANLKVGIPTSRLPPFDLLTIYLHLMENPRNLALTSLVSLTVPRAYLAATFFPSPRI